MVSMSEVYLPPPQYIAVDSDYNVVFEADNTDGVTVDGTVSSTNYQPINSIVKDDVTVEFYKDNMTTKGSTNPGWFYILNGTVSSRCWRMYANNMMTFVPPKNKRIKKITFHTISTWDCPSRYGNLVASTGIIRPSTSSTDNLSKGMEFNWIGNTYNSIRITVPEKSIAGNAAQFWVDKITIILGD